MGGMFSGVGGKGNILFWATLMEMVHTEQININGRITSKFILREIGLVGRRCDFNDAAYNLLILLKI